MIWFFLDTHERGLAHYGWIGSDSVKLFSYHGRAGGLFSQIVKNISRKKLQTCAGICVVSGPGSFSGIRSGVLMANLISRIYGLPLYAVSTERAITFKSLIGDLEQNKLQTMKYVAPIYDAEPNITIANSI